VEAHAIKHAEPTPDPRHCKNSKAEKERKEGCCEMAEGGKVYMSDNSK
jgi:hypothetical protein